MICFLNIYFRILFGIKINIVITFDLLQIKILQILNSDLLKITIKVC